MKLTKEERELVDAFLVRLDNVIEYCKAHGGRCTHTTKGCYKWKKSM